MDGIIASRNYFPGDLIFSEQPFVKNLLGKNKEFMCEWCCKTSLGFLKTCKECKEVKYCGRECQKNDWPTHRLECKHLKNLPQGGTPTDYIRFLGKILLKVKDTDWNLIKKRILGKDFSFEGVDSHETEFRENPKLILLFKELKELLVKYIGFENVPDDELLRKVIGKTKFNSCKGPCHFFCLGVSQFDCECIPNSSICFVGTEIKVWASKRIRKGIDKISLPRRRILSRTELIDDDKLGSCKCTDCSLPYGESILSKIIDEKRAFSVIEKSEAFLLTSSLTPAYECDLEVIEKLLRNQREVLGHTNHLHLKLLAFKCLEIGGHPILIRESLLELERDMKSVFGEYYVEMMEIYQALSVCSLQLGNPLAAAHYMQKAKIIIQYGTEPQRRYFP